MIPGSRPLATVFVLAVVVKGVIVCLEAKEKRKSLLPKYQHFPPEATSGVYNAWFFWWLNPLFLEGYKKTLTVDQLFAPDEKLLPEDEGFGLLAKWRKCCTNTFISMLPAEYANCDYSTPEEQT